MRKGDKTTRILVAEDDPVNLRLLRACLVEWGYKVTSVTDGQKALEILQGREAPRLAILEWIMPGMNGIDICREIRKQTRKPYTYISMSTAKVKKQDMVEGLQSGADDYLIRPYKPQELRARLRAGRRILDLREQLLSAYRLIEAQRTVDPLTGVWSRNVILDIQNHIAAPDAGQRIDGPLSFDQTIGREKLLPQVQDSPSRAQARAQFLRLVGPDQVVVRAGLQTLNHVLLLYLRS